MQSHLRGLLIMSVVAAGAALAIEAPSLASISCTPSSFPAGSRTSCTITLDSPPATPVNVTISYSGTGLTFPATRTFAIGVPSLQFSVTSTDSTPLQTGLLRATVGSVTKETTLTVTPAGSYTIRSLSFTPNQLFPGASARCIMQLSAASPVPLLAQFSSSSPDLLVPASMQVTSGANFVVTVSPTATLTQNVTITARIPSDTATTAVQINATPPFFFQGSAAEAPNLVDGALVTPTHAPSGWSGRLGVKGSGHVDRVAVSGSNGLSFRINEGATTNSSFVIFSGPNIGNLFGSVGEVSFLLRSAYSWAERKALAASPRYVFEATSGSGGKYGLYVSVSGGQLVFSSSIHGRMAQVVIPAGQEDELFGRNVTARIRLRWFDGSWTFYLNDLSFPLPPVRPDPVVWQSNAALVVGARTYPSPGSAVYSCDDAIADFKIFSPGAPANQAPTANAGSPQTISLPSLATLSGTAQDDGLPNPPGQMSYGWTKASGPGSVTFGSPAALATTASFSAAGTYVLRLTASDSLLSDSKDVQVTVQPAPPINQAPVVVAGSAQTITLPSLATLSGTATDDGLPAPPATLTYSWTKASGPGTVNFGSPSALATTASFSAAGTYVLRLTASDSLLSAGANVQITVQLAPPINQAPVANAGSDQALTLPSAVTLSGSSADDGLPNPPGALSHAWSKVSGPGTVSFSNANLAATTASFSAAGTYVLRLTVSDSVLSDTDDVQILASVPPPANQAPVVGAGSAQTITLPSLATLSGTATDDGLPTPPATLTYSWTKASGPGTVSFGSPSALMTTASFSAAGTYVLRLTASDSLLSDSTDVQVTVQPGQPGLIGYWNFDQGSGFTATDTSASSNHGSISGATWTVGKVGSGALSFSGSSFVSASGNNSPAFTASAWFKTQGTISSWKGILEYSTATGLRYGIALNNAARIAVFFGGAGTSYSAGNRLDDGAWHHVAATFTGSGNTSIYLDGALVATLPGTFSTIKASASTLRIGDLTVGGYSFAGTIDEVRLYNRALSAQEVASLITNGDSDPPSAPTGLTAAELGTVKLGKSFRMKLELPEALAGQRRVTWKVADPAQLPPGVRCSRGRLGGRPSAEGLFVFTVTLEATIKSVNVDGKKTQSTQSVQCIYQLRVTQAE